MNFTSGDLIVIGIGFIVASVFTFFYWLAGRGVKRVKKLKEKKLVMPFDTPIGLPNQRFCSSCGKWKEKKRVRYLTPAGHRMCDVCYNRMYRQIKDGKYD